MTIRVGSLVRACVAAACLAGLANGSSMANEGHDTGAAVDRETDAGPSAVGTGSALSPATPVPAPKKPLFPAGEVRRDRGLVADHGAYSAIAFSSDPPSILASLHLGSTTPLQCAMTSDGGLAFVTDFSSRIWVIDMASDPPQLATGINPIFLPSGGADLDVALTPDDRYLLVNSLGAGAIFVFDLASRTLASTLPGVSPFTIEVCRDGSVLLAAPGGVVRYVLDPDGVLHFTGERLLGTGVLTGRCAPDGRTGIMVDSAERSVTSFSIPGLLRISTRGLSGEGGLMSVVQADRVFVRSSGGWIETFDYDGATGNLGAAPVRTQRVANLADYLGLEQMEVDPTGRSLFISEPGRLRSFGVDDGSLLETLPLPLFASPAGICFRNLVDADSDGLSDQEEAVLGTDPMERDSDHDGLIDGFEARFAFDPTTGGDEVLDPDGDGLTTLDEQTRRTDPRDADSDDDGLGDGDEVAGGTDPLDADTDHDGLTDGEEISQGTDPRNPDTDGGAVFDGDERDRDATDPLDPDDDLRLDRLLVCDNGAARRAVVIDPGAVPPSGPSIGIPSAAVGDAVVSADGGLGFVSDTGTQIFVVDMRSNPPRLDTGTNPISVSSTVTDMALSPDGRFLVACGGTLYPPISVVDVASRTEVSTFDFPFPYCTAIDVCRDGSVLVADFVNGLRRLTLDAGGVLHDTGEVLGLSDASNVLCASDGRTGVLLRRFAIDTFQVSGLTPIQDVIAYQPTSGALHGRTLVTRSWGGFIEGWDFDPVSGTLGAAPAYGFDLFENNDPGDGMDRLAVDPYAGRLYVAASNRVDTHDLQTGAFVAQFQAGLARPRGTAFRPALDSDADGLPDDRERALGTDPHDVDTDDDGLYDDFEAHHGLDPTDDSDAALDPDADGLSNLEEQNARTDPSDPDTDDDGLTDGDEIAHGTDPHLADTDGDGIGDAADNCGATYNPKQTDDVHPGGLGDDCADPDGDGVFDATDVCPDVSDPTQTDTDADGRGDACDLFPTGDPVVKPVGARDVLAGAMVSVTYRLEDRRDGRLLDDVPGVRTTLTLSGSATFGAAASGGLLVSGGGTNRALVEFVAGVVTLTVHDEQTETVVLGGEDSEANGLSVLGDVREDFEMDDGGFVHSGSSDPWEWGVPTAGPQRASSGAKVWAVGLTRPHAIFVEGSLVSRSMQIGPRAPSLRFQNWLSVFPCCELVFVEAYSNLVGSWQTLDVLTDNTFDYVPMSYDLSAFTNSAVRIRFRIENTFSTVGDGWFVDDFEIRDLDRVMNFLDPGADPDGDGAPNADEVARRSDPFDPDTDLDGISDPGDNCPAAQNADQADVVHPGGRGDACDDPDGDGAADAADDCPDAADPSQADGDADGVGDACDPYPTIALAARPQIPPYAVAGGAAPATWRLEDRSDGRFLDDVSGVRATLTLSGAAVFGSVASTGVLVSGAGTSRALVEFVDGLVTIDVIDPQVETIVLDGEDTERNGVVVAARVFEDFEANDGGFTHSGANDRWRWGVPTSGPQMAHSGLKVWAMGLDDYYPDRADAGLVSRPLRLSAEAPGTLSFASWLITEEGYDFGSVRIRNVATGSWTTLESMSGLLTPYTTKSYDLAPFAGAAIQVGFFLQSDNFVSGPGWFVDDFAVEGLARAVEFLDGAADLDGDGVSNADEVSQGSDPRSADSDQDGIGDGADRCPTVSDPSQTDTDADGTGDACECLHVVCPPIDDCHEAGACQPASGECTTPPKPVGTLCSDDNACTRNDRCNAEHFCAGEIVKPNIDCNDHNACTRDLCDPELGCWHSRILCRDGDPQTVDTCDRQRGCVFTRHPGSPSGADASAQSSP